MVLNSRAFQAVTVPVELNPAAEGIGTAIRVGTCRSEPGLGTVVRIKGIRDKHIPRLELGIGFVSIVISQGPGLGSFKD